MLSGGVGPKGVRGIIFDFDGTLVCSQVDFASLKRQVIALAGAYEVPAEHLGNGAVLETIQVGRGYLAEQGEAKAQGFVSDAFALIEEQEVAAARRAQPYEGVEVMLARLRGRDMSIAIVTRNCRAAVEAVMDRVWLDHDLLLTRDDVAQVKPHPRHLLCALEGLGLDTAEALMCGDHPMDVMAGKGAGMFTVAIGHGVRDLEAFAEVDPDAYLERVVELPELLGIDGSGGERPS